MGEHLMITRLVALGRLDHAVERQNAPEMLVFEDHQVLKVRLGPEQYPGNLETLLKAGVKRFGEPGLLFARHSTMPRFCSLISARVGAK